MLSRFLLKRLVLPLLFASAVCLLVGYICPWQGFFVNLSTTFVGILFTFLYVDYIIQRHERQQWAEAKERILQRIEQLGFVTITNCRISFGFRTDIFVEFSRDPERVLEEMRPEMIRIAENVLIPETASKIERFDQTDWKRFVERVQTVWQSIDRSIELFGSRLDPKVLTILLDIQDKAWSIIVSFMTWPDIYGVPDDKLPVSKKISTVEHKRALNRIAAETVRGLLSLAVKLIQEVERGHGS